MFHQHQIQHLLHGLDMRVVRDHTQQVQINLEVVVVEQLRLEIEDIKMRMPQVVPEQFIRLLMVLRQNMVLVVEEEDIIMEQAVPEAQVDILHLIMAVVMVVSIVLLLMQHLVNQHLVKVVEVVEDLVILLLALADQVVPVS
jgi:hypothetical protein